MTAALDAARQKIIHELLAGWETEDVRDLSRLLRRFADGAMAWTRTL
jgi:hypothetical protein